MTTSRYDRHMTEAAELLAEGFGTKKAQADARQHATRAFSEVRELVQSAFCAIPHEQRTDEQHHLYWAMPSYPHEWREKHAAGIRTHLPQVAEHIPAIEAAVKLAATIKATPVVPKPKAPEVINPGDKTQLRGHCQCCGRVHAATSGYVAQHGYTVRHGFFKGGCPGHRYQPMEKDRAVTDRAADAMDYTAKRQLRLAQRLKDGKSRPALVRVGYGIDAKTIPFEEADARQQREAIKAAIYSAEAEARHLPKMAQAMRELADRVHGQPLVVVKV